MSNEMNDDSGTEIAWWQPVVFAALAGGMGWGIRGQYGHETGAMIPGLLVSLTLVFLLCPRTTSRQIVRAVAWGTVAMGFGGSMTYGQTVGLTHDASLIGNWGALSWGMLGLAIKGGVWIGFAGAFLGMGLSGIRYRSTELLLLMLGLVGAYFLGVALLNGPFDPANKVLPPLYFSDHWRWEPGAALEPRRECWGGLLFALMAAIAYAGWWRKDRLAPRLALWGMLGGAVGFPLGQSLAAFHSWNPELLRAGLWSGLAAHINWWNMMETTFGATMGAMLGLGLWLNRRRIMPAAYKDTDYLPVVAEWTLLAVHLALFVVVAFLARPVMTALYNIGLGKIIRIVALYNLGLVMGIIPIVVVARGRWSPYLVVLPITLLPIAAKTLRQLAYTEEAISPVAGWFIYMIVPLSLATVAAIWFAQRAAAGQAGRDFVRRALLLTTWIYFLLNFAFFRFPWPWADWTGRTPNGIIFTIFALALTALCLFGLRHPPDTLPAPPDSS